MRRNGNTKGFEKRQSTEKYSQQKNTANRKRQPTEKDNQQKNTVNRKRQSTEKYSQQKKTVIFSRLKLHVFPFWCPVFSMEFQCPDQSLIPWYLFLSFASQLSMTPRFLHYNHCITSISSRIIKNGHLGWYGVTFYQREGNRLRERMTFYQREGNRLRENDFSERWRRIKIKNRDINSFEFFTSSQWYLFLSQVLNGICFFHKFSMVSVSPRREEDVTAWQMNESYTFNNYFFDASTLACLMNMFSHSSFCSFFNQILLRQRMKRVSCQSRVAKGWQVPLSWLPS